VEETNNKQGQTKRVQEEEEKKTGHYCTNKEATIHGLNK
jgi:hypothetical protein